MNALRKPLGLLKNEQGIGLIVLIMVIGLCTLLALGNSVSQAEFSQSRLKLTRTKKNDMLSLKYEMNFILSSRSGCAQNFKDLAIAAANTSTTPVSIPKIEFGDISGGTVKPLILLTDPALAHYGRVPIKRMSLVAHDTKFGPDGSGTHLTMFEVEIGKPGTTTEADDKDFIFLRRFQIPVYVTTDSGGAIQSCHSTQFATKDAAGNDVTLEEKLCNDAITGKTANWPADCLSCLNDGSAYHLCIECKGVGKIYDPSVKKCV